MIDGIKDRTYGLLDNFRRSILTCDLNSTLYNQPLWKHIYHALYWFDYWYSTPENFAGADFDCADLSSLDISSDVIVTKDDLLKYYEAIKIKTIKYLENLSETQLNEICESCNGKSRFECILGQFTHASFHLGNVNAMTVNSTGKWPYVAIRERHCSHDLYEYIAMNSKAGAKMQKQLEVFYSLLNDFKNDKSIQGVLLTGSVALNSATEQSDLDIIVLSDKNDFISKVIDDVIVEIFFITFDTAIEEMRKNPVLVYRYLDAKIEYDNENLQAIIETANKIYNNYIVPNKEKKSLYHWLRSTKAKLLSAYQSNNKLQISYIVSTNTWTVLEGMWAVNGFPMPPSSTAFRSYKKLTIVPNESWFEDLLHDDCDVRGKTMCKIIDWILPKLEM